MMDQMMGGVMMWGMGLIGLLIIIVLVLAAAALVKAPHLGSAAAAQATSAACSLAALQQRCIRHDRLVRAGVTAHAHQVEVEVAQIL